ncbi:excinuclease ATPase [Cupriavidus sp. 2TAF22]|uniref:excinuclease ATPase n=1 Tax=unclassified Cupriavidus TaxID=2640874 RepID=UPI003F915D15
MKRWVRFSLMAGALLAGANAQAGDQLLNQPIDKALASADAKARVDPSIKLQFGLNRPADVQGGQSFKTVKRIRRPIDTSSATGGPPPPGDEELCATTFVQAVQELQQRAMKEGGNAVIDIRSNWKNDETASDSTYVCAKGGVFIGVALKGVVVRTGS